MAEAPKPKYDSLPGIDTAPDVYETPDLAEDVSTVQASTTLTDSEDDDSDEDSGLKHRHLQANDARSRFQPTRVDARGVDFSDNISAQRKSYRTSTRGRHRAENGILGDDSADEKESFAQKLLRVKQELAELEEEFDEGDKSKVQEQDPREVMEYISDKVDYIYAMRRGGVRGAEPLLDRTIEKFQNYAPFEPSERIASAIDKQPTLPGSQVQKSQLDFVLTQAADFDKRLADVENALGVTGTTMPDLGEKSTLPVFTTLEKLEQTIGAMADASSGNLEAASAQIRKLIADADQLGVTRENASRNASDKSSYAVDQEAKVNALYGTLPTIDKISPLLPLVLERLRTLRLVHTSAWQANEVLTELERRQSQQEDEIKKWEQSLKVAEKDVETQEKSLQQNMKKVGEWVKRLEDRVAKIPG
jgi:nuclear migration protein JNM1